MMLAISCKPKPLVLLLIWFTSGCSASSNLTSNRWKALGRQTVTSFEMAETGRSKVDCMRKCTRYSHCNRVAFRPSSSLCYLLPSYNSSASDGDSVMVYQNTDAICSYTEAPVSNATVTWRHKLTSLEGDVTCDSGYLWSTNNVTVTCMADNEWTVSGQCQRRYWTSPSVNKQYQIPRPVVIGWQMCARGTPFADATMFSAYLFDANGDRALKVMFKFASHQNENNTIKASSQVGGGRVFQRTVTPDVFPVQRSVPFSMKIRASADSQLQVLVNDTVYYTHVSAIKVSTVVMVKFVKDVTLLDLDLWCE